jgi:hypothetical protein
MENQSEMTTIKINEEEKQIIRGWTDIKARMKAGKMTNDDWKEFELQTGNTKEDCEVKLALEEAGDLSVVVERIMMNDIIR